MGTCMSNKEVRQRKQGTLQMRGKIDINCPICQQSYDIEDRKPYVVCQNKHKLCFACLSSMKNHARLKKIALLCPFCKVAVVEDMVSTDSGIYGFLEAQLDTLRRLPQNRQKLFAFSSIYLPHLHKFMKEEVKGDDKKDKKSSKRDPKTGNSIDSIELLRIKGRMLEEYQVFEMEMLDCMYNLRKVYLSNNHIKAIDTNAFTHNKLTLIDLSFNRITTVKSILSEPELFAALKVLNLRNNMIEEMPGVNHLQTLQILNMKHNSLKSLRWFTGCNALRHLDIEFNKITQRVQFPAGFTQLHSLMMFGNKTGPQTWQNFAKLVWKDLRLLTATVANATLLEKNNVHNRIFKLPIACLKLLIFQVDANQPENTNDVVNNVGYQQELLSRLRKVQLNSQTYIFYSQNDSFLKKIVDNVLRNHPLGRNVNFKPVNMNLKVYLQDERFNAYKKISKGQGPTDYLYSLPVGSTAKDKILISFIAKTFKLLVGVVDQLQNKRIELDLDREIVSVCKQESRTRPFKGGIKVDEEYVISIAQSINDDYITFAIGNTLLDRYIFPEKWSQHRFYVHLMQQGQSIRVIRDQMQII